MGFDLVTWAPRVGSTGDDVYNVPGGTKLDGSVDTGGPCTVQAGDSSGFSATPTVAQLNASSGINQVIGLYNRRALMFNAAFGTSLATIAYIVSGTMPKATDFTNILTKINTLRGGSAGTNEGWTGGNLAWPISTPTAGQPIMGHHLAFLRKALAISGTMVCNNGGAKMWQYTRNDSPYGTGTSESQTSNAGFNVGQITGPPITRSRTICNFRVPDFVSAGLTSATLGIQFTSPSAGSPAWNYNVYSANSDVSAPSLTPAYGGTYYTANSALEGSFNATLGTAQNLSITAAHVQSRANGYMGFLCVSSREFAGTVATATEDAASAGSFPTLTLTF